MKTSDVQYDFKAVISCYGNSCSYGNSILLCLLISFGCYKAFDRVEYTISLHEMMITKRGWHFHIVTIYIL